MATLLALLCGGAWPVVAQAPPPQRAPAGAVRVTTRLVLVDVVVIDKEGRTVGDLKKEDFALTENGKQQSIATFTFEQAELARAAAKPAPLPPNFYTNRPEYRTPPGPLTMLLLDALNTPLGDQAYARQQMLKYLETQLQPNQGTAILALGNSLRLLQDFTSDPQLLRAAVQKYTASKSTLLTEESDKLDPSFTGSSGAAARLQEFEQEQIAAQTDVRVQITLAALRSIARTAAGFPGRKVLIWVSGAFPISLDPQEFITGRLSGLSQSRFYAQEVERTAALLADAQVAIYPVDARGLVGPALADASRHGSIPANAGIDRQGSELLTSHQTMMQLAEDTGGRAFINRNDIDQAVASGAAEGATYYELGYYPEAKIWDGKFHKLAVKVQRAGVVVRHRRGYFATDPAHWRDANQKPDLDISNALREPIPATQVVFIARVVPQAAGPQTHIDIQFAAYADTLSFEEEPEGRHHASVDFLAVAVSPDGKIAANDSKTMEAHLRPETYARVQKEGVPFHMDLQVAPGNYQLHLGVRDNRTGWIGTLTVPLPLNPSPPAKP